MEGQRFELFKNEIQRVKCLTENEDAQFVFKIMEMEFFVEFYEVENMTSYRPATLFQPEEADFNNYFVINEIYSDHWLEFDKNQEGKIWSLFEKKINELMN